MELLRGEGRTICTLSKEAVPKESFTLDYHNGLDVPRGENPSQLQSCEWPIGDRGD